MTEAESQREKGAPSEQEGQRQWGRASGDTVLLGIDTVRENPD